MEILKLTAKQMETTLAGENIAPFTALSQLKAGGDFVHNRPWLVKNNPPAPLPSGRGTARGAKPGGTINRPKRSAYQPNMPLNFYWPETGTNEKQLFHFINHNNRPSKTRMAYVNTFAERQFPSVLMTCPAEPSGMVNNSIITVVVSACFPAFKFCIIICFSLKSMKNSV